MKFWTKMVLHLNEVNVNFLKKSVTYLGYKIDNTMLRICREKIRATNKAPIPDNPF